MRNVLDYASLSLGRRCKPIAIAALVCGLSSGPIAWGLVCLQGGSGADGPDPLWHTVLLLVFPPACAAVLALVAARNLNRSRCSRRERCFVFIGAIAPVAWALAGGVAVATLVWYAVACGPD